MITEVICIRPLGFMIVCVKDACGASWDNVEPAGGARRGSVSQHGYLQYILHHCQGIPKQNVLCGLQRDFVPPLHIWHSNVSVGRCKGLERTEGNWERRNSLEMDTGSLSRRASHLS